VMFRSDIDRDEDYLIEAEVVNDLLFLHCNVEKTSKSVLKRIRDSFEVLLQEALLAGYDCVYAQTENLKFVKFLGQPYEVIASEGNTRLVVWQQEL
jgi:hypothetical protein